MATATEMTLTLGRTVYGGDPSEEAQNDERIEGRETRVSVTWRLTEDEQNLPLMASMLAEEAVRALGAAERTVCRNSQLDHSSQFEHSSQSERMPARNLPQTDLQTSRGAPQSDVPAGAGSRPTYEGGPYGSSHSENGSRAENGSRGNGNHGNGIAQIESKASAAVNGSGSSASSHSPSSSYSPRYIAPITKAQRLAIQSLCTRHGVADWELRRLVWEQFGKKEQGELNKEQAAELLAVLQQGSQKDEANNQAYAN